MNICFVNTTDLIGGAERCGFDLHTGLRALGHKTSMVVGRRLSDDPDVHPCHYGPIETKAWTVLRQHMGLTETVLWTPFRKTRTDAFREADVINFHNMHGCYWNFWTVPFMARTTPVVLTLHDEWLYTGDCAYTYDCDRWLRSCGSCPQMSREIRPNLGGRDLTRLNLMIKRAAMKATPDDRVHIVTPSQWLANRVGQSQLGRLPRSVIPNGIDLESFRPRDRRQAKADFNVPQDRFCFLYFAVNLSDPRKGVDRLVQTLRQYGLPPNSVLLVAGNGCDQLAQAIPDVPVIAAGFLDGAERIASCLSAADCMLLLSEAENLPYTAIEAAACGCPVIGLAVGGVREIVQDRVTGRVLNSNSKPADLHETMREFAGISPEGWSRMSADARCHAEKRFSHHSFLRGYEELFSQLIARRPKRKAPSTPADQFEQKIVDYALEPANRDRFARLLTQILPSYTQWTWGRDDVYRRNFNHWQAAGFSLLPNHYYSPIPDTTRLSPDDLARKFSMKGVDLRESEQLAFLGACTQFQKEYVRFSEKPAKPWDFHYGNGVFESCDAEALHCAVRLHKPRRVIEVGSGFTTLITAAACEENRIHEGVECDFTAIEPYPNDLFQGPIPGLSRVLRSRLQDVDLSLFATLQENDILFIDSSHVLKTGSDVELLYLEVLPALNPGVLIHVHDIFLPAQYPRDWIMDEHIFWNEQHLLYAFLAFNNAFKVLWAGAFMHGRHPERLADAFPAYDPLRCLPGSFWMRRSV